MIQYKKIRAEKDASVSFSLTTNEQLLPLAGRQLQLIMHTPTCRDVDVPFSVLSDKISFNFVGKQIGQYSFTVYENRNSKGATAVDLDRGIEVVARTWVEGGEAVEGLDVETISLGVANLAIGIKGDTGDSAYEVAVKNGYKGTEPEWLESLKADADEQIKQHNQNPESHADIREKLSELEGKKANKTDIPTNTSELNNDSGFLTEHQDISGKLDKSAYNQEKVHFAKDTDIQTLENNKADKDKLVPVGGYNRALYEAAGAVFNEKSGYYELNGLTDITEAQMADIYNVTNNFARSWSCEINGFGSSTVRTNIPPKGYLSYYKRNMKFSELFRDSKIEVLYLNKELDDTNSYIVAKDFTIAFNSARFLRKIIGIIDVSIFKIDFAYAFGGCNSLQYLRIAGLKNDILLASCENMSKDSILYMIQKSKATSGITITLHPTAYAMAMADTDIKAALKEKTLVSLASA